MGITKTNIFNDSQNQIANQFKALAHPARIAIIQYLLKKNTCICNNIVEEIGLAQSTVSQHLKELKKVGLIKGNIEGTAMCYCLNTEVSIEIQQNLNKLFDLIHSCNQDC